MRERRFAFVLRLWIEHGDQNDAPVLRGSLQAVESDRARYFTSLDDIPDLVRELTRWRSRRPANHVEIDVE
jgi:hypothetical protein